jgi:hypothetical protein
MRMAALVKIGEAGGHLKVPNATQQPASPFSAGLFLCSPASVFF